MWQTEAWCNAGITRDAVFVKVKDGAVVKQMSEEAFDLVVAVNLKRVFNCTQAVAPHMIKKGGGSIINASSVAGLDQNFGQTNYAAIKAGVVGMTRVWSRELGGSNIRVNAIAPGMVLTEMLLAMPPEALEALKQKSRSNTLALWMKWRIYIYFWRPMNQVIFLAKPFALMAAW